MLNYTKLLLGIREVIILYRIIYVLFYSYIPTHTVRCSLIYYKLMFDYTSVLLQPGIRLDVYTVFI